ncbi:unnamed protein product, partial [Aphanomyces euteiches]
VLARLLTIPRKVLARLLTIPRKVLARLLTIPRKVLARPLTMPRKEPVVRALPAARVKARRVEDRAPRT